MKCIEAKEILSSFIDDMLEQEQKNELINHLRDCPSCRENLEQLRIIVGSIKASGNQDFPKNFRFDLHDRLIKEKHRQERYRFVRNLGIAATLVLAVSFGLGANNYLNQVEVAEVEKVGIQQSVTKQPAEKNNVETLSDKVISATDVDQNNASGLAVNAVTKESEEKPNANTYNAQSSSVKIPDLQLPDKVYIVVETENMNEANNFIVKTASAKEIGAKNINQLQAMSVGEKSKRLDLESVNNNEVGELISIAHSLGSCSISKGKNIYLDEYLAAREQVEMAQNEINNLKSKAELTKDDIDLVNTYQGIQEENLSKINSLQEQEGKTQVIYILKENISLDF